MNKYLLAPRRPGEERKKCVIIDLDETLVHSSFKVHITFDWSDASYTVFLLNKALKFDHIYLGSNGIL